MKKSSWCKSRIDLSFNGGYALIPLYTILFQNSMAAYSFYRAAFYLKLALKLHENCDLRSTNIKKFLHEYYHMFTSKKIQVLRLLKKENTRIKYKLNFWKQGNSVLLSTSLFRESKPLTLPVLQHPNHAMTFYCIPVSKHGISFYGFHHSHSISFQPSHLPTTQSISSFRFA